MSRTLADMEEELLLKKYEQIFKYMNHSNEWKNTSVVVSEPTPSEVVQRLKGPDGPSRGRDFLFEYTDSRVSKPLLELRIPSIQTGDLLIGGLSYNPNKNDPYILNSTDIFKNINKKIVNEILDKENKNLVSEKPSEHFPDSDLMWIRIFPQDPVKTTFINILDQLTYGINVIDDFYHGSLPDILSDGAMQHIKKMRE